MAHRLLNRSDLTFNVLVRRLTLTGKIKRSLESYWRFYQGDHYDQGRGYLGPHVSSTKEDQQELIENIQRMFGEGYRNVGKECVNRVTDGIFGKNPDWKVIDKTKIRTKTEILAEQRQSLQQRSLKVQQQIQQIQQPPTPQPQPEPQPQPQPEPPVPDPAVDPVEEEQRQREIEAERVLMKLWNDAKIGEKLRTFVTRRLVQGKSFARIYIPSRFLAQNGEVSVSGSEDALIEACKLVNVEFVEIDQATLLDDEGDKLGIVKIEKEDVFSADGMPIRQVELSFVGDDGMTYIATINQGSKKTKAEALQQQREIQARIAESQDAGETTQQLLAKLRTIADVSDPIDLAGEITLGMMEGDKFLTPQFIQNNRALNLSQAMAVSTLVEAGFNELALLNVELAYDVKDDPNNVGKKIKVPKTIKRGGGVVQSFVGVQTVDAEGNVKIADPEVIYKEPSPMTTYADAKKMYYQNCLEEARQTFVQTNEDANTTGESRIQARQDFLKQLQDYKPQVDAFGTWLLTTMMNYVASAAGMDGHFDGLIAQFDAKIFAGELSADEQRVVIDRYKNKLISKETAMVLLGIEDPMIEIDKILVEEKENLVPELNKAATMAAFQANNPNNQPQK